MNKVSRTFGVGIVAASLTFAGATVAQATEAPYTLAAWVIPGGDSSQPFAEPQPFAMSMNTDVDSLEGLTLECGTTYQLDLYLNNEVTQKNVVPGALLNGPNNPFTEQWITGKWRGMGVDSAYVTTDACVVVPPVDPPVTPPVDVPEIDTPESVEVPVSENKTIPVTAELAYTGTSPALPIGFASLFLAVGAFLIRKAARA